MVFHNDRRRLQRFQHASDLHPCGKVYPFADLRTGAHEYVRVNHGPLIHKDADIHIRRRHHHDRGRQIGPVAHAAPPRHDPDVGKLLLQGYAIAEVKRGRIGIFFYFAQGEKLEHCFFHPLLYLPPAFFVQGDAQAARIQELDDFPDLRGARLLLFYSGFQGFDSIVHGFGFLCVKAFYFGNFRDQLL